MIKEIATVFDRYHLSKQAEHTHLLDNVYLYEAELLYENFEDRNIYDLKTLREYVKIILKETSFTEQTAEINEDMILDLHRILLK